MNLFKRRARVALVNVVKSLLPIVVCISLTGTVRVAFGQGCPPLITDPVALNTNAATDDGADVSAALATDGVGTWMVVWRTTNDVGGTTGSELDMDIVFARSVDNGATWTPPAPVHNNAGEDLGWDVTPHIVSDGPGSWVVVWISNDDFGLNIGHDFDIIFARSSDNGATWTDPAPVNINAVGDNRFDFSPRVAADGLGHWVVVWASNNPLDGHIGYDDDILFAHSSDYGATWSFPAALASNAGKDTVQDREPEVVNDGSGTWMAVWHAGEFGPPGAPNDHDILYSRSMDNGHTWSDAGPLNTNADSDGGSDREARLSTDGAGTWVAVWRSNEDLNGEIGADIDIFVAHSADNGETWSPPAALNSDADSPGVAPAASPQVTSDGAGRWLAVWESTVLGTGDPFGNDHDVFSSISTDGGQTWTDREPVNTNARFDSGNEFRPQLATDGQGQWVAAWDSDDELGGTIGPDRDILLARFQTGGSAPVMICHFPPGNPSNRHTLIVPQSAVPAHLAHGDHCGGPCGAPHPPASESGGSEAPACPPDLDSDSSVASADLALLLGSWGPCPDCANCPADLDGDCTVGALDLAILLDNWG